MLKDLKNEKRSRENIGKVGYLFTDLILIRVVVHGKWLDGKYKFKVTVEPPLSIIATSLQRLLFYVSVDSLYIPSNFNLLISATSLTTAMVTKVRPNCQDNL